MKKKETVIEKINNKKLIIAVIITLIVLVCTVLQFTPVIKIYWIKAILERIVQNKWNLWFISLILIIIYNVEKRMFLEKEENIHLKGDESNDRY